MNLNLLVKELKNNLKGTVLTSLVVVLYTAFSLLIYESLKTNISKVTDFYYIMPESFQEAFNFDINQWDIWRTDRAAKRNMDNEDSRQRIKMIHILAKNGAKWLPKDRSEIGEARRSLLKMKPDYTVEFIWIMSKYNASRQEDIEELIRTPSIRSLISQHSDRVAKMINKLGSEI